ncbi:hypothetical protein PsorP6_002767 [Peronosclerospora sorghi]|uniref:Uncharacterized protein n=1 Tax=Peronosclerospora sorghi TaxID=230839 RepID=A0ACC0VMQ8_9STRA|nr:hypothetical protein PsorP6_002767 [Peronosclerospora sorghi]
MIHKPDEGCAYDLGATGIIPLAVITILAADGSMETTKDTGNHNLNLDHSQVLSNADPRPCTKCSKCRRTHGNQSARVIKKTLWFKFQCVVPPNTR